MPIGVIFRAIAQKQDETVLANLKPPQRSLLEGRAVLVVIDIQASTLINNDKVHSINNMLGYKDRMLACSPVIDSARANGVPVVFIQEIHRADLIDFGRELDGSEDIHCLDNNPQTEIAKEQMGFVPGDYLIQKRRYSAFFGTDFEILLRGLKAETLLLVGGLTDVCVHYTFADGHQLDCFCRVLEECVAGSSTEAHNASLKAMGCLQTGAVCRSSEVMEAMQNLKLEQSA